MKYLFKISKVIACTLILSIIMTSSAFVFAIGDPSQQLISYIALLVGHSENDITILYNKFDNVESFMNEIDALLSDIIIAEQWDSSDTIVDDLDKISTELNVDTEILQRHINICGEEYFRKRVCSNSAMPFSDSTSDSPISSSLFAIFYSNAHTGNIFLTKDSVSVTYRHGHTGIVSSHVTNDKKIVEALGDRDDPEDEIVERDLTAWNKRATLAIYYPSNTTTTQRENAGYYATHLLSGTYTALVKKGAAIDVYPQMNCISLVYLSYLMSVGNSYDLVPQVASSSYLLPSQIQFSTIIALKTTSNGMLRTSNWNDYDWA